MSTLTSYFFKPWAPQHFNPWAPQNFNQGAYQKLVDFLLANENAQKRPEEIVESERYEQLFRAVFQGPEALLQRQKPKAKPIFHFPTLNQFNRFLRQNKDSLLLFCSLGCFALSYYFYLNPQISSNLTGLINSWFSF